MSVRTWNIIFLICFIAYMTIRGVFERRTRGNQKVLRKWDGLEKALLAIVLFGSLLLPALYIFTPWLSFADYRLPKWSPWCGLAVMLAAIWLFWRSHVDLGQNWSITLELRKDHELITHGVYRTVRHPMYASIWLFSIAQALMLANWLAGFSALVSFAPLYFLRTPREEAMMCEFFGDQYRNYMKQTGRLLPRPKFMQRVVFATALLLVFANPNRADDQPKWELVWKDEFDGKDLDPAKWDFVIGGRGGGNNELQYYLKGNVSLGDGMLHIEARREKHTGPDGARDYTSARIRSKNNGDWKFARIEIRAKLPKGKGIWPAIWMLPTDNRYGNWPNSGEIDIVELVGSEPDRVHGTLHYGDRDKRQLEKGDSYTLEKGTFADEFHTFRLDWEPQRMRWYVDDKLYQTQADWHTRDAKFPAPFDQRFHLILNLAVGGSWPGKPDEKTTFPQSLLIDWVRVHQPK